MKEIFYYSSKVGEWIPIYKTGKVPNRIDEKGKQREITIDELQAVYDAYKGKALGDRLIPIVQSHWGDEKAYGWIQDVKLEDETLYGLVEWNDEGKKVINDKTYLYLSPEIIHDYKDDNGKEWGEILFRAALTNSPALDLPALETNSICKLYAYSILDDKTDASNLNIYPVPDINSQPNVSETEGNEEEVFGRDELREKAKERSKKWGIPVRDDGHLTPPAEYGDVEYADPVNYRYPIDKSEHALAALKYFSKEKNRSFYPPKARVIIWERIIRACLKFGISVNYDPVLHKGLPESLKKKLEGYTMDNEKLEIFISDIKEAIKEDFENLIKEKDEKIKEYENKIKEFADLEKDKKNQEWFKQIDELLEKGCILPAMVEEFKNIPFEMRDAIYNIISKQKIVHFDNNDASSSVAITDEDEEKVKKVVERIEKKLGGNK